MKGELSRKWKLLIYKQQLWTQAYNEVSEEHIASIFKVEESASEEPAWAGGSATK
jgi:hypothetical protein